MRAVAVAVVLAWVAPAWAQTPGASVAMVDSRPGLAWRAPASCPDATSLRTRIEQRLERSLDDVTIGVEIDVALTGGTYVARVDLRAMTVANDVRTLTSKRCSELADAVAVIVTRVASEAIARQRTAIHEETREQIIVEPPDPPAPPRLWSIGARMSGVSGIGVIPKVGLAGEFAIVVRRGNTLAELAGTRWMMSAAQFHDGAPAKVDVDLDTAALRVGWRPIDKPLRAWGTFEYGHMNGNNIRLPSEQLEAGRWLAAGGGFGVAWQMTKWVRLLGATETMLALDRVRFTLGDGIIVYAPSPMSFRASAGLEVGWQ
jgi:hypothetical protein